MIPSFQLCSQYEYFNPVPPRSMVWEKSNHDFSRLTCFVDHSILAPNVSNYKGKKIAALTESEPLIPEVYNSICSWVDGFDHVITHSNRILNAFGSKARFKPASSVTIGCGWSPGEIGLHPKSRLCSMLTSTKKMTQMHLFRLKCAQVLHGGKKVDVTVSDAYGNYFNYLKDYLFNVSIENFIDDYYFTERVLNCFACGTIPVYCGASKIGDFFNSDGILSFRSVDELNSLVKELSPSLYLSLRDAIVENFNLVLGFYSAEDYLMRTSREIFQ
jgi:hypothetical protein